MRIHSIEILKYELPLIEPLLIGGITSTTRCGLVIKLTDDEKHPGYGEIAPLPGLHMEKLEEAREQLTEVSRQLIGNTIPENFYQLSESLDRLLDNKVIFPSVRFGIELALANLLSEKSGVSLHHFFSQNETVKQIAVNALIPTLSHESVNQARDLVQNGYTTIKIKVGRQDWKSEAHYIQSIQKKIDKRIHLRLDANRAWDLNSAVLFSKAVSNCNIEYMEEPLQNYQELSELCNKTTAPIALDETLSEIAVEDLPFLKRVKAFVIKPGVVGGLFKTIDLIRFARQRNVQPVLSSPFFSGLALKSLVQIAASFVSEQVAMGFDPYRWLLDDLLAQPLEIKNGKIDVPRGLLASPRIKQDLLTPIELID